MKVGMLGAGNVAQTLGRAFALKGHEVFLGTRDAHTEAHHQWLKDVGSRGRLGSIVQAASFGDVIVLAINPWTEIEGVLKLVERELAEKVIIDVSNNIVFGASPQMAFTHMSMGEFVQKCLPKSQVVKTLNLVPAPMMVNPATIGINPAIMWISGDSSKAKSEVSPLLRDLGWMEVVDLGGIDKSRLQEAVSLMMTIVVMGAMSQRSS